MSHHLLILYNDDEGLAHGTAEDRLATIACRTAAEGIAASCRENGWWPRILAAPTEPGELCDAVRSSGAACVFNLIEAVGGETLLEAAAAWILELAGLPYTGSPPLAIELAQHKPLARDLLRGRGVPLPAGVVLARGDEPLEGLTPPLIVKPAREDASHGISLESVCSDEAGARQRARFVIERYRQPALVEEFIDGRELNVSVLGEGDEATTLSPGEIDFSGFPTGQPHVVTYAAKWMEESAECQGTHSVGARDLHPELARRVTEVALSAYRSLGLRDYGRVDLRLHPKRGPLVIDVNPNPDLSPDAGLARAAGRSGLTHAQLVGRIVESALARGSAGPARGGHSP